MICTEADAERPDLSATLNVAWNRPFSWQVNVGFGCLESTLPSASKSQKYRSVSPSGSLVPALENSTVSGAALLVGVAATCGTGVRPPRTKVHAR